MWVRAPVSKSRCSSTGLQCQGFQTPVCQLPLYPTSRTVETRTWSPKGSSGSSSICFPLSMRDKMNEVVVNVCFSRYKKRWPKLDSYIHFRARITLDTDTILLREKENILVLHVQEASRQPGLGQDCQSAWMCCMVRLIIVHIVTASVDGTAGIVLIRRTCVQTWRHDFDLWCAWWCLYVCISRARKWDHVLRYWKISCIDLYPFIWKNVALYQTSVDRFLSIVIFVSVEM